MASSPRESAMLWTEGLGVTYPGAVLALKPTAIAFDRGQFTVLLGLSGAGKSTLLRALNHLVTPSVGRVMSAEFGNLKSPSNLRQHRRKTAMVFQHHQLIERHTALENVMIGRLAYHHTLRSLFPLPRRDLELAMHCLERVGLADKALTRVDQLSGGQQQRVGIARALAQEPSLILADEPVASLDPATSERVLTLLRDICREDGIAAVVSLHQLDYAKHFADRIVGLANAEIVFDAAPQELTETEISRIYRDTPLHTHSAAESQSKTSERTTPDRLTTTKLEIAQ